MRVRLPAFLLSFLCAACAVQGGGSYERHSLSRLHAGQDDDSQFVFEARAIPGHAREHPDAEAVRMQWLAEWLTLRGACEQGYEIAERRLFSSQEYNPHQSEYRYLVRCRNSGNP